MPAMKPSHRRRHTTSTERRPVCSIPSCAISPGYQFWERGLCSRSVSRRSRWADEPERTQANPSAALFALFMKQRHRSYFGKPTKSQQIAQRNRRIRSSLVWWLAGDSVFTRRSWRNGGCELGPLLARCWCFCPPCARSFAQCAGTTSDHVHLNPLFLIHQWNALHSAVHPLPSASVFSVFFCVFIRPRFPVIRELPQANLINIRCLGLLLLFCPSF